MSPEKYTARLFFKVAGDLYTTWPFQNIELYWAELKGDIGRQYFKSSNFQWRQSRVNDHYAEIECNSLIRRCKDCMNAWLEQDDVLSGAVGALVVPAYIDNAVSSLIRIKMDTLMILM